MVWGVPLMETHQNNRWFCSGPKSHQVNNSPFGATWHAIDVCNSRCAIHVAMFGQTGRVTNMIMMKHDHYYFIFVSNLTWLYFERLSQYCTFPGLEMAWNILKHLETTKPSPTRGSFGLHLRCFVGCPHWPKLSRFPLVILEVGRSIPLQRRFFSEFECKIHLMISTDVCLLHVMTFHK